MGRLHKFLVTSQCSAFFLDARLVRALAVAEDPSCRVVRPFLAKLIARLRSPAAGAGGRPTANGKR